MYVYLYVDIRASIWQVMRPSVRFLANQRQAGVAEQVLPRSQSISVYNLILTSVAT